MTVEPPDRRLSKRDAEVMLSTYDDDPVAALETALRRLCGRPTSSFDELVGELVGSGRMSSVRAGSLLAREVVALDALAAELNETRSLPT
jgi:hypothetical protein